MNQSSAVIKKRQKQINAIVIATSLFFLSITSFGEQRIFTTIALSSLIHINPQEVFALITIVIVTIFASSAIATCLVSELGVERKLVMGALVYLFFTIFLIAL
ncbi:MAG: hypothetical protein WAM19_09935 [Nitrososphaeraceae archaeon]